MANTANAFSVQNAETKGPYIFIAEHASNRIPTGHLPSEDRLLQSHWAWDIGIASLMSLLSDRCNSPAVFSQFSRLFCDANRHPNDPTLIKESIEGQPLSFNRSLTSEQKQERIRNYHIPYHSAIAESIVNRKEAASSFLLLSLHSFTPVWNHHLRSMDIGILFDQHEELAIRLAKQLESSFFVSLNEPYSGKKGLIYSADRHGREHQIPYLELEINQTLLSSPHRIQKLATLLGELLLSFSL